jgi:hypothetical protein
VVAGTVVKCSVKVVTTVKLLFPVLRVPLRPARET